MIKADILPVADNNETDKPVSHTWGPINFLNLYRILISGLFVTFLFSGNPFPILGSHDSRFFYGTSAVYLASALGFGIMIRLKKPAFYYQVHIQIISDIVFTTMLMHASGGVSSGLGTLIIIAIASGSIVIRGKHALLFASIATIAVLFEHLYSYLEGIQQSGSMLQAGILGVTFFTTSIITHFVAKYIQESEALAEKRGVDLANMAQLTEHIIQRMQTGIIVVDAKSQVRLINDSARHMLDMPVFKNYPSLEKINAALYQRFKQWCSDDELPSEPLLISPEHPHIIPRFAKLSQDEEHATLVFLEDASAMSREAQQLQLASLGRLTASIAHEIRNPLGAISHAGQLLEESPNLDKADTRLTQIIADHSKRMNTIVENVMQLGKGNQSYPQLLKMKNFVNSFIKDFIVTHQVVESDFLIHIDPEDLNIRFDPNHLYQILSNLCENGFRHTESREQEHIIELNAGITENNRPYLDVIDQGSGIDDDTAAHIFEPFYTKSEKGTGLGLYISRELAECNQAHITYSANKPQGSCFRITFSDPRRQMH